MLIRWRFSAARLTICIASSIGLFTAVQPLQAQRAPERRLIYLDSIVLIGNPRDTLNVAYVFPRRVAIEYYNIRTRLLPAKDSLILGLRAALAERDASLLARDSVISGRDVQVFDLRTANAKADTIIAIREKQLQVERRRAWLFKRMAFFGIPAGLVGGFLIGYAAFH